MSFENIQRSILPAKTNSLAPRQGLVFDGTAGTDVASVPAFGTGDFTFAAWVNQSSLSTAYLCSASGGPDSAFLYLVGDGTFQWWSNSVARATSSAGAIVANKWTLLTATRTGGTTTLYANGVSVGSGADSQNLASAINKIGQRSGGTYILNGSLIPLIYNRALSASEVVALYESGAPSVADYKQYYGTPKTTVNGQGYDGASYSSGTFTVPNSGIISFSGIYPAFPGIGVRLRVKFDYATTNSGNLRLGDYGYNPSINGSGDVIAFSGSGTYIYEAVANSTGASWSATGFEFRSGGWTGTITNITITPLGLLLAPDAAQAGGGLVWYDTSGNAANISWTSGVSWNVPSSAKTATGWTYGGNLTVSSSSAYLKLASTGSSNTWDLFSDSNGSFYLSQSGVLNALRVFPTTGNFSIGAGSTDGGQKLQVSGTAAATSFVVANSAGGGVVIGNSTGDYGSVGYNIAPTGTGGVYNYRQTDYASRIEFLQGGFKFKTAASGTAGNAITFTDALTIDSSQNAYGSSDNTYFSWDANSNRIGITKKSGSVGKFTYGSLSSFVISQSSGTTIQASNTFTDRLTIDSSGDATFAGQVNILNANSYLKSDASNLVYETYAGKGHQFKTGGNTALTLDNSQNATFAKDILLGTSGPSVKSTLSARAPRQGLVFDGSTSAVATVANVPAFGTSDFTVAAWVNKKDFAAAEVIFGGVTAGFELYVNSSDGKLRVIKIATAINGESTTAIQAGKWTLVTYTRSGGSAGTFYINGISAGTVTEGSPDYSAAVSKIGSDQSGAYFNGTIAEPLIYNRALSASEVVSLYEAGAPSGADYGASGAPASNTSLITGADSTFSAGYTWTSAGSVSITGGEAVWTGGGAISNPTGLTVISGKKYRVTIDITQASTNGWAFAYGSGYVSSGITGTGVKSYEFTATATGGFGVQNGDGPDGKLTSITLLPIGLLLAPDAAQAGGGLVWYDTSGNAANISWTSGVSWNVPSSSYWGGTLNLSGSNNYLKISTTGTPASGTAALQLSFNGTNSRGIRLTNVDSGGRTYDIISGGGGDAASFGLYDDTSGAYRLFVASSGNVLIGTSTDSTTGKLQLASSTSLSAGIGFGSDVSLYRSAAGTLSLMDYTSAATGVGGVLNLQGFTSGTSGLNNFAIIKGTKASGTVGGVFTVQTSDTSGNPQTALTLDSSQNATFAGNIIGSKDIQLGNTYTLTWGGAYGAGIPSIAGSTGAGNIQIYPTGSTSGATAVFTASTSTFNTPIAIGNTVNTVSPTSPNRTITIVVGGTTYYIPAKTTND